MKKLFIACLLTGFASISYADEKTDPAQAELNAYTQLCLMSLRSEREFIQKARELGVTKNQRDRLVCNNMSIDKFVSTYELIDENTIATVQ